MTFDLTGKTAFVTGASSGLGRHFALTLARHGAKVAMGARRTEKLKEVEREVAAFDGRAIAVELDVTDPDSVRRAVEVAETELGALSVLVNNAGVAQTAEALTLSEADWDQVVDTNLKGAWLVAQETARHMERLQDQLPSGGSLINVASILGLSGSARVPAYAASKGGLISLTRAMAVEWARHGLRVNALAPGYIETDLNRAFLESEAGQKLKKRIPQRRFGTPADLDGPLLLLASDLSAHMTGSVITIDGGHSANL
jgi:NAD(P)-dependent dehydrogenase (short-subunit alcohol dehydrogenase family)